MLSGAAGAGKPWLGCALGVAAVQLGLSVRYVRTNPTLDEMRLAHLDGSIAKLRSSLIGTDLPIPDDFGIAPISEQAKEDLLELLEGRIDQGRHHGDRAARSRRVARLVGQPAARRRNHGPRRPAGAPDHA